MTVCESIDTLSMAYLDDELADEERHELETHLTECAGCRAHLEAERADSEMIARSLAAPPASDLLRAKIARSLDAADRADEQVSRKRVTRWILPGGAIAAAAAALIVFAAVKPASDDVGAVARDAVRVQNRPLPLEVQGASTGRFLRQNFSPSIEAPQFADPTVQLLGGRLTEIEGHDAAMVRYSTATDDTPMTVFIVRGVGRDDLGGDEVIVGNRTMHVGELDGKLVVVYVDDNHVGYTFTAPGMSEDELLRLVASARL
jgi:anti-sigma factor RsiW